MEELKTVPEEEPFESTTGLRSVMEISIDNNNNDNNDDPFTIKGRNLKSENNNPVPA